MVVDRIGETWVGGISKLFTSPTIKNPSVLQIIQSHCLLTVLVVLSLIPNITG
jgi:hypothetical protein